MNELHFTASIHEAEEGGYWAEVPALSGCFAQGETIEQLMVNLGEAIQCHLRGLRARGEAFPVEKPRKGDFAIPISVASPEWA